jgi:GLPGLI family protein
MVIKIILVIAVFVSFFQNKPLRTTFSEGVISCKTSFPGHALNDTLNQLDLESGNAREQYKAIGILKRHQKSIAGENEQEIKDAFFVSGMMLMPLYSKMYFTVSKLLIETNALGYHQEALMNSDDNSAKIVIADRENTNQGTIKFSKQDLKEVWQKYQINGEQYSIKNTTETAVIAGYRCKKIIYTFNGTSRGPGVSNYIINLQPEKVTIWYTDDLPASINLMHTLDFELQKAVLKYEVEYDKNRKNKMLCEVTKVDTQKIEEEKFDVDELAPVVEHKKNGTEAGMMVMQVMMNAISLLTK